MAESVTRGRMARLGCVSISIDADSLGNQPRGVQGRSTAIQAVTGELIDQFQRHRLPASWAFLEPASAAAVGRIIKSGAGYEVALQADAAISPQDASRGNFVRTVIEPLRRAAAAGVPVSSMVTRAVWQPRHLDVLTKYGIRIVRSNRLAHGANSRASGVLALHNRQRSDGVQIVCYGLWHVPVSFTLEGGGWMANHAQMRVARRAVERVVVEGGFCHFRIDAASLAHGDAAVGLRHIDRLLRELAQLRSGGRLQIHTLCGVADLLQPKRMGFAARSILRAA